MKILILWFEERRRKMIINSTINGRAITTPVDKVLPFMVQFLTKKNLV
jgi:hypothetical protein